MWFFWHRISRSGLGPPLGGFGERLLGREQKGLKWDRCPFEFFRLPDVDRVVVDYLL